MTNSDEAQPSIKLGNHEVKSAEELPTRLSMLLWGMAGCGKTTLAATAPGTKLWINFDPDGLVSVSGLRSTHSGRNTALNNHIYVVDFSSQPNRVIEGFKRDDHLGLGKLLGGDEIQIDTVVVDSLTRISQMSLEYSVERNIGKGVNWQPTIETPGQTAYGARNALTYRVVTDILNITKKYNKNVIFISHEAAPTTNDQGIVLYITMSLGGQLPNLSASQISEVWFISDTGKQRRIAVRPARGYKPMKTRMFQADNNNVEFDWKYDINNPDPKFEIATWWKEYQDGNQKIALPK